MLDWDRHVKAAEHTTEEMMADATRKAVTPQTPPAPQVPEEPTFNVQDANDKPMKGFKRAYDPANNPLHSAVEALKNGSKSRLQVPVKDEKERRKAYGLLQGAAKHLGVRLRTKHIPNEKVLRFELRVDED